MSAGVLVPYPPLSLADRVCSLKDRGVPPLDAYEQLGAETKQTLVSLLPEDWSFADKRVMDFGCGAGRTLRHFVDAARAGAEVWGVDVDAESIAWLQEHLAPPLIVRLSEPDPPLALEPGSFDLIWAVSVFTHLTDSSLPWLLELHRLLKPGGLLIATYMGRWNSGYFVDEPWDEDRVGMLVMARDNPWHLGGPMVMMSDWWVRAHWGRAFEIVHVVPEVHAQSWALLRRREVELTVDDLERPDDDPREYLALRRAFERAQRDHVAQMSRLRREYEDSTSWRITRPLRGAAERLRARRSTLTSL